MQLENVSQVIATRTLDLKNTDKKVIVTLGKPQAHPEGDYFCPFQISGCGDEQIHRAGGIDEIQALLIALEGIGIILAQTEEYKTGQLSWIGSDKGNFGFPKHDSSGILADIGIS